MTDVGLGGGHGVAPLPDKPVVGTASGTGTGVLGQSNNGPGVLGQSVGSGGANWTDAHGNHYVSSYTPPTDGVRGEGLVGVHGVCNSPTFAGGAGLLGENAGGGPGVLGENTSSGPGVHGKSNSPQGVGVLGENTGGDGVLGQGHNGVHGVGQSAGVLGEGYNGVQGESSNPNGSGVWGNNSSSGNGVGGHSAGGNGVVGTTDDANHSGVAAINNGNGHGLYVQNQPGGQAAGHFQGDVEVIGKLTAGDITGALVTCLNGLKVIGDIHCMGDVILGNQDCAEDFDVSGAGEIDPGTVVVIDSGGALRKSDRAYDKRVAGVVSGAGDYKPGIILGRQKPQENKKPIALVGKVFCKVDAGYSPIEVGDLLTTSATPGHAMKASDPGYAFGSIIGKALSPLQSGLGIVPILVALQ